MFITQTEFSNMTHLNVYMKNFIRQSTIYINVIDGTTKVFTFYLQVTNLSTSVFYTSHNLKVPKTKWHDIIKYDLNTSNMREADKADGVK